LPLIFVVLRSLTVTILTIAVTIGAAAAALDLERVQDDDNANLLCRPLGGGLVLQLGSQDDRLMDDESTREQGKVAR
jgi:hypothetical protein